MQQELVSIDDNSHLLGRLRSARKSSQLTQQEVADHLGLSRTTVVAIENGVRALRDQELLDLAGLYGRSVNELLRPTPIDENFVVQFRTSPAKTVEEQEVEHFVSFLQELADDYVELERLSGAPLSQRYPPEISIRGVEPTEAAENLAANERNRLGLGDGPVLGLRELLEFDAGLRIFALDLPAQIAGLFVNSSVHGACIAMNANHYFERQRWSLAHEYAHFLAHRSQSEVTILDSYQRVPAFERFADAFAECFLMPASGVKRRFQEIRQGRAAGTTPADLLQLAALFQVSFEAMVRRLENLRLVRPHTRDKLFNSGFRINEARELLGLDLQVPDSELLPFRFRCLAIEAWSGDMLSEGQLARMLRVDRTSARKIAANFDQSVVIRPDWTNNDPAGKTDEKFEALEA